ncbi:MAG: hypothetical protein ACRC6V_04790 [Bacteroidales bacterium]
MKTYEIHLVDGSSDFAEGHTADMFDGMITVYKLEFYERGLTAHTIAYQRSLVDVLEVTTK